MHEVHLRIRIRARNFYRLTEARVILSIGDCIVCIMLYNYNTIQYATSDFAGMGAVSGLQNQGMGLATDLQKQGMGAVGDAQKTGTDLVNKVIAFVTRIKQFFLIQIVLNEFNEQVLCLSGIFFYLI